MIGVVDIGKLERSYVNVLRSKIAEETNDQRDIQFVLRTRGGAGQYDKKVKSENPVISPLNALKQELQSIEEEDKEELERVVLKTYRELLDRCLAIGRPDLAETVVENAESIKDSFSLSVHQTLQDRLASATDVSFSSNQYSQSHKHHFTLYIHRDGNQIKMAEFTGFKHLQLPDDTFTVELIYNNNLYEKTFTPTEQQNVQFTFSPLSSYSVPPPLTSKTILYIFLATAMLLLGYFFLI